MAGGFACTGQPYAKRDSNSPLAGTVAEWAAGGGPRSITFDP
jgi:hypothetical protein